MRDVPIWYILLVITVVAFGLGRGILSDQQTAIQALENQGFNDVTITDHSWFAVGFRGCSGHDAAKFTARATNPAGNDVEVFVCTGWPFKGGTVRS